MLKRPRKKFETVKVRDNGHSRQRMSTVLPFHTIQPSSLPLELLDQFVYQEKIGFKLIKIQLCEAKMSLMRVTDVMYLTDRRRLQHLRWRSL